MFLVAQNCIKKGSSNKHIFFTSESWGQFYIKCLLLTRYYKIDIKIVITFLCKKKNISRSVFLCNFVRPILIISTELWVKGQSNFLMIKKFTSNLLNLHLKFHRVKSFATLLRLLKCLWKFWFNAQKAG